jgi:hypothetical protein
MAAFETFQSREEPALLFIQQAVEQDHCGLKFLSLDQGQAHGLGQWERLDLSLPCQPLFLLTGPIPGAIEPAILEEVTAQAAPFHQGAQGIFDRHVQEGFQFANPVTGWGRSHPSREGVEQSTVMGEPGVLAMPQALSIKLSNGREGVISPAMRIAGEVGERGQFTEDRHVDVGAEGGFELWESNDWTPLKETLELVGIEEERAHNVMILPCEGISG